MTSHVYLASQLWIDNAFSFQMFYKHTAMCSNYVIQSKWDFLDHAQAISFIFWSTVIIYQDLRPEEKVVF